MPFDQTLTELEETFAFPYITKPAKYKTCIEAKCV